MKLQFFLFRKKSREHKSHLYIIEMSDVVSFLLRTKISFFTKQKNVAKYMDPFFRRHLPTLDCIKYNTISSYTLHHLEKCLILWNTEITIDIFLDINRFIACIFTKYSRLGKHVLVWARNKTQSSKLPKNRNLWHHIDWNRV